MTEEMLAKGLPPASNLSRRRRRVLKGLVVCIGSAVLFVVSFQALVSGLFRDGETSKLYLFAGLFLAAVGLLIAGLLLPERAEITQNAGKTAKRSIQSNNDGQTYS